MKKKYIVSVSIDLAAGSKEKGFLLVPVVEPEHVATFDSGEKAKAFATKLVRFGKRKAS